MTTAGRDPDAVGESDLTIPVTVVAQDPSVREAGRIVRAAVRIPRERLAEGPRGQRFFVVDYDAGRDVLNPPADLSGLAQGIDEFAGASDAKLLRSPAFRAQNVYAIAARTLEAFESALGRRVPWGFGGHQLHLVPTAFAEANAYYSDDSWGLFFGYLPADAAGDPVYTCLSHDIVAHETTHAVLDGLRRRFEEPGLPDQAAFHEALADIVALLLVFSTEEVAARLVGPARAGRVTREQVSVDALRNSALFTLAEELGDEVHGARGQGLRRSVSMPPSEEWRRDPRYEEPHLRGEVVVGAVMQTLLLIWRRRLEPLIIDGRVDRARAVEEGAKAARHLLTMVIRSIDYTPPLEFEFEDFLHAVLLSDAEVTPDDDLGYRTALTQAFGAFGIHPPKTDPRLTGKPTLRYRGFNYASLRTEPSEVFRFVWENAGDLGIDTDRYTAVEEIRPALRIGPDGFFVSETVATYVQMADRTKAEWWVEAPAFRIPEVIPDDTPIQILGGGVVVFDQFAGAKYHISKPLDDWERQSRRLEYLVRNGFRDTRGRYGFSLGTPRGQRFAELHRRVTGVGETW